MMIGKKKNTPGMVVKVLAKVTRKFNNMRP